MMRPFPYRLTLAFAAVLAGSACSLLHKPESTAFTPTRDGFEFRAIAEAAYPENTANGESWRMRWRAQKLVQTGTCPHGYDIVSREPVLRSTGALGGWYDVYYVGRCRSDASP